ncbi:hypothetical protein [Xenococcus sp. PCC 7305]|uniref:hypothetical protein n=1 Tax=Xenococcus sp. PCC 7305 TaxID=102125 RepID=UPI00130DAF4C|nr:hypothetical protein [Xenococcus sp. PCC 7305]
MLSKKDRILGKSRISCFFSKSFCNSFFFGTRSRRDPLRGPGILISVIALIFASIVAAATDLHFVHLPNKEADFSDCLTGYRRPLYFNSFSQTELKCCQMQAPRKS